LDEGLDDDLTMDLEKACSDANFVSLLKEEVLRGDRCEKATFAKFVSKN
jgi:hypothetical protein